MGTPHSLFPRQGSPVPVLAWQQERNQAHVTIDWRFTMADARIKLKRLYPIIN